MPIMWIIGYCTKVLQASFNVMTKDNDFFFFFFYQDQSHHRLRMQKRNSDHHNLWTLQILVQGFQLNVELVKWLSPSPVIGFYVWFYFMLEWCRSNSRPHSFWAHARSLEFQNAFFSIFLSTDKESQYKFCKQYAVHKFFLDHPISYQIMQSHSLAFFTLQLNSPHI